MNASGLNTSGMTSNDNLALIAIDQGTTSSRAIGFAADGEILSLSQKEHKQHYPQSGWVEHDANEIWQNTFDCLKNVAAELKQKSITPKAIGITNQRETVVAWDKQTGTPLYNALVWQDKRTAKHCEALKAKHGDMVKDQTGLPLDPYFSASKMQWLLQNVDAVKEAAENQTLAFGTIDSFLLFKLTGGKQHLTDTTNACRTLLFNLKTQNWSDDLLTLFEIPAHTLPSIKPNTADFGKTAEGILENPLPIAAMVGDQHAATFGQACFKEGMVKSTYGTGCFAVLNTGHEIVPSEHGLLTTVAYHIDDQPVYALEGSIFVAGAGVQWLRDKLQIIKAASETEELSSKAPSNPDLYFVPAFAGLGAPWWDSAAKGSIVGMTLDTDKASITKAMLDAVCLQTNDLLNAMAEDLQKPLKKVRIDGGMIKNDWLAQRLSCLTGVEISRPEITETTAFGAALMAGLQVGVYGSLDDITKLWKENKLFTPIFDDAKRAKRHKGWKAAVKATQTYAKENA